MRQINEKEQELRVRHPRLVLMTPSCAWMGAYMEQIDQGWHDYKQDVESLRCPRAFSAFVERINSGKSWDGSQEAMSDGLSTPQNKGYWGARGLKTSVFR